MWLTSTWGKTFPMSRRVLSILLQSPTTTTLTTTPLLPRAGNSSRPFPTCAIRPGTRAAAPICRQLRSSSSLIRRFCGSRMDPYPGTVSGVSYLSQKEAAEIDELLMGPLGFSVDQLMELAGLSVASAISEVYKVKEYNRILVICGPGNNGGDGLVAARHLHHFGYTLSICYPKRTPKALYNGLVTQLKSLSIQFLSVEDLPQDLSNDFDIIVDSIFGFSFHGTPRSPFDDLIQRLVSLSSLEGTTGKSVPLVSVDIPSGWHVEEGDINGVGLKPHMLVSLTAPKLCAKKFSGPHHFLGGRFVPPSIIQKYSISIPQYPGTSMCVRIGKPPSVDISALRENYISPEFLEDHLVDDPIDQFQKWFDDAVAAGLREPNAMILSTANREGKPSSRVVLLKGFDKNGFVWYTNYGSRKARDLSENCHAALLFHWNELNRQVRIEGFVEKVSNEEAEKYFHSRPWGSQIGALASKQSSVIAGRQTLYQAYADLQREYSDGNTVVPKPDYWGGYRLFPNLLEFWQGQPSRMHDRLQFSLKEVEGKKVWQVDRLAP